MAQNRTGVHILADASGLSYEEVKGVLYHIMLNTPQAASLARDFVITMQGGLVDPSRSYVSAPDQPRNRDVRPRP